MRKTLLATVAAFGLVAAGAQFAQNTHTIPLLATGGNDRISTLHVAEGNDGLAPKPGNGTQVAEANDGLAPKPGNGTQVAEANDGLAPKPGNGTQVAEANDGLAPKPGNGTQFADVSYSADTQQSAA